MNKITNTLQYNVACAQALVQSQEIKLQAAQAAMDSGYTKAQAEFDATCSELKHRVQTEAIELERTKAWLLLKKQNWSKGLNHEALPALALAALGGFFQEHIHPLAV